MLLENHDNGHIIQPMEDYLLNRTNHKKPKQKQHAKSVERIVTVQFPSDELSDNSDADPDQAENSMVATEVT